MYTKTISAGLMALLASVATAQTHTACSPILRDDCPNPKALGKTVEIDFTKGDDKTGFFKKLAGTEYNVTPKGAEFTIAKPGQAPTLVSNSYIFGGKVEVKFRAAPGAGIVSSIVLQSDDLDEIDWEHVGNDQMRVQSNYFSKGNDTVYGRGQFHDLPANGMDTSLTYTLDWTKDQLQWIVNGKVVRTLKRAETTPGANGYPQTPCQIRIGTWVGGAEGGNKGTIDWAGGLADFSKAPFTAIYESIKVTDYSTGATEYQYTDRSGNWESIKVIKGDGKDNSSKDGDNNTTTSPSSTKASNGTATGPSTMATSATRPSNTSATGGSSTNGSTSTPASKTSATPAATGAAIANLPNLVLAGAAGLGYFML
ncbi:hypothetical protein MCOR27_009724 [Pyricularia oryzae]|uniref:Crh-like protein n=5 Tax=Pyricularia TaxID=48558 RepID=Q5G5B4_PYRGI|nr:cell wall glucanosyltransferase [Pyricularia oryzae 70-15]AAW69316.1 hypothetical protein [Pyricularia grisea]ELQ38765.1 cell wall glucanosyltransferase Mwg1 [Pyricularia oryzae Y34]KAH8840821.1 hypothetical protein MCOR01_007510 [Pyricularia oryzae]EHA48864.1 cell wall glucanosyltransferase [Pyricularia oryzae 70-15]KAH9433853.1 hypothetical protein MCOR02_005889 [Pyricularia oryzae]